MDPLSITAVVIFSAFYIGFSIYLAVRGAKRHLKRKYQKLKQEQDEPSLNIKIPAPETRHEVILFDEATRNNYLAALRQNLASCLNLKAVCEKIFTQYPKNSESNYRLKKVEKEISQLNSAIKRTEAKPLRADSETTETIKNQLVPWHKNTALLNIGITQKLIKDYQIDEPDNNEKLATECTSLCA